MADLVITAADVAKFDGAETENGTAGEDITAGEVIYQKAADGKQYLADVSTVAKAAAKGIALNTAAAGQPVTWCKAGPVDVGAVLSVGQLYCVSSVAGGIAPYDATDGPEGGEYVTTLGIALAADKLQLVIDKSGVAVPA